jgi:hypothetical protein
VADNSFTTRRTEYETPENRTKRLFLLTLEALEKYAATAGFNLKDAIPGEALAFWKDYKSILGRARNTERAEKEQRAAEALATAKANDANKAALSPNEMSAYQRAHQAP